MATRYVHYQLEVVQQPLRARMCGFSDKDRRMITPAPCLRLRMYDASTEREIRDISNVDISNFAVVVEIYSEDMSKNCTYIHPKSGKVTSAPDMLGHSHAQYTPLVKNLIGTVVSPAHKLYGLDDDLGIWFIVQDLSVRVEGNYSLKFSFCNLQNMLPPQIPGQFPTAPILCTSFSAPFKCYAPKKFPGVPEATELNRCFANQGVRLSVRRETARRA